MQAHQLPGQCQANPQPALQAVGGSRPLYKRFKHPGQQFGRDADARILNRHDGPARFLTNRDRHFAIRLGKLQRICQQVVQYLLYPHGVAAEPYAACVHRNFVACCTLRCAKCFDRVADAIGHVEWLFFQLDLAGNQPTDVQQVVDDMSKVAVLAADDLNTAFGAGVAQPSFLKQGSRACDSGQRIPELMSQHRQKLVFGFVLRLGGFAFLRLIAQQALPLDFRCLAGLSLCLQQGARTDQCVIQLVDFFDASAFNDGLLAPPKRIGGPAGAFNRPDEASSKRRYRQYRHTKSQQHPGHGQPDGVIGCCLNRFNGRAHGNHPPSQIRVGIGDVRIDAFNARDADQSVCGCRRNRHQLGPS